MDLFRLNCWAARLYRPVASQTTIGDTFALAPSVPFAALGVGISISVCTSSREKTNKKQLADLANVVRAPNFAALDWHQSGVLHNYTHAH